MKINGDKSKVLNIGKTDRGPSDHHTNGHALEKVDFFSYLGSKMEQTARVERDVGIRLEKAATVRRMWRWKVFKSQNLSKIMKVRVFRSMVMSVLLYGAEDLASNPSMTSED